MTSKQQRIHSSPFLDAKPNSIGILFTTPGGEEEEVLHLWLSIGERIYTREDFSAEVMVSPRADADPQEPIQSSPYIRSRSA